MLWHRQSRPEFEDESEVAADALHVMRAALDEVRSGIVVLDAELRATFINRTFRRMWRLPDDQADSNPAFVALMYHGRDTRAYAVPARELDAYIAERVALVRAGDPRPVDLRLASGEVVHFQCSMLPDGGRMLSYTYVTEIARQADELSLLRAALDHVAAGVLLLDRHLNARFMNEAVRRLWNVDERVAAGHPSYAQLLHGARVSGTYAIPPDQLDAYIAERVAHVRAGDPTPVDLQLEDGRTIRTQCSFLPDGGRMLTYSDVSDLTRQVEDLQRLAVIDAATGLLNRRHFHLCADAEWDRFQRYHRPLALILLDIDRFKSVNDRHGHEIGDRAIAHVADLCTAERRSSDLVARMGGDELALLLPETDLVQAAIVAERVRQSVERTPLPAGDMRVPLTVSVGLAGATLGMASVAALMRHAEQALARAKAEGRNRTAQVEAGGDEYDRAAE
jgi:diguanylate cyclase (GGDEF)-like protein